MEFNGSEKCFKSWAGEREVGKGESQVQLKVVAPTGLALRRLKQEDYNKLSTDRKSVLVAGTSCAKAWSTARKSVLVAGTSCAKAWR